MPESEDNRPTRQSDCYALGMIIYEVGIRARIFVVAYSRSPTDLRVSGNFLEVPRDAVTEVAVPNSVG